MNYKTAFPKRLTEVRKEKEKNSRRNGNFNGYIKTVIYTI